MRAMRRWRCVLLMVLGCAAIAVGIVEFLRAHGPSGAAVTGSQSFPLVTRELTHGVHEGSTPLAAPPQQRASTQGASARPANGFREHEPSVVGDAPGADPAESQDGYALTLVDELLQEVHSPAEGLKLSKKAQFLLEQLKDEGVDVASLLMEEYRTLRHVGRKMVIIQALELLASEQSRAALLELALTDDPSTTILESYAAQAFTRLAGDSSEIAQLLFSPEEAVLQEGARALKGAPLNREVTKALSTLLRSRILLTHTLVADAFAADTSSEAVVQKANSLLSAVGRTGTLKGANRLAHRGLWTEAETAYRSYVFAMCRMRDAEGILRLRLPGAEPRQREAIVIVLAFMERRDVHAELVRIIETRHDAAVRTLAVQALGYIATKADIALLQRLAVSDPLDRADPHGGSEKARSYPVREIARRILSKVDMRSGGQ